MSERNPCIRCDRAIDAWSKICPFCNWDQSKPAPPPDAAPRQMAGPQYVPEDDLKAQLKAKGFYALGGVLVLVASFLVGMVINSDGAPDEAPVPLSEQEDKPVVPPIKRADTPLVPTNEKGGIEQPITSAPAAAPEGVPTGYERSDATAVSSVEYSDLAKRAKAERERMSVLVDPRELSGAAYAQGRHPAPARRVAPMTAQQRQQVGLPPAGAPPLNGNAMPDGMQQKQPEPGRARRAIRTRPVPQFQPIPRLAATGTARLTLIIGADGRVRDINIERALNRNTADLVAAVHKWRFKPATEDGEPVAAPYSVDISFGGQ